MTPRTMVRLNRLEAGAAPPSPGKHLTFQVEAPHGAPVAEIVAFLRTQGHAIHDEDDVFVMNLGAHRLGENGPVRDLSGILLTEEVRAGARAGGKWPSTLQSFNFTLDSPRRTECR